MIEVRIAHVEEWPEALELFHRALPEAEKSRHILDGLASLHHDRRNAEGFWIARESGRLVAVLRVFPLGGDSLLVMPPVSHDPTKSDEREGLLLTKMLSWADENGIRIAQTFVRPGEEPSCLTNHGFLRRTHLLFLQHPLFPMPDAPPQALRMQPLPEAGGRLFRTILDRTYHDSLDAPELNGLRTIDQVMDGLRQEGRDRPELWALAWHGNDPIGVVILTQLPEGLIWNLAYMGVVPEARGNKWGYALAYWAMERAHAEGALELWNSVDERNIPARKLYRRLGFEELERKSVLLRIGGKPS